MNSKTRRRHAALALAWLVVVHAVQAEELPVLSIAVSRAIATEGSRDPVRIELQLDRPAPEGGVCIDLDLAGGSARPGEDFNGAGPVPPIPAGASSASLPIMIVDDDRPEPDESVRIVLRPSNCYQVGAAHEFDLLIRDDDEDAAALQDRMQQLIANTPDPLVASQLANLGQLCATSRPLPGSELDRRCQLLRLALRDPSAARQLVDSLRGVIGEELSSQRRGFRMLAGGQLGAIGRRLDAVRSGAGAGVAVSDLLLPSGLGFLPLSASVADDGELLGRGWGVYLSGVLGRGDRNATTLESGYSSDTRTWLLGADRRLDEHWLVGAAFGRNRFDAELDADAGNLELRQSTLTLYLSYARDAAWIDASLGGGRGRIAQTRVAQFSAVTDDESIDTRDVLRGSPDASLRFASLSAGWDWQRGNLGIGPRAAVEYAEFAIDGFAESAIEGSDAFAVAIERQRLRSLLARAGGSAQWAISWRSGVLLPQLEASWVAQLEDSAEELHGRFVNDPQGLQFTLPGSPVDNRYAEAAASFAAQFSHGRSLFISYRRLFGLQDTEQSYWSAGARLEF